MKYARVVLLVFLLIPGSAFPQPGVIAVYGDSLHVDCNVVHDPGPGVLVFYVFHHSAGGARECRFSAPYQSCMAEIEWGLDRSEFLNTTGSSQTGVTIEYGLCLTGWVHVLTVFCADVLGLGCPPCCEYPVLPHPDVSSGQVEDLDCDNQWVVAEGVSGLVNSNSSCPCKTPSGIESQDHTWGKIKALYE